MNASKAKGTAAETAVAAYLRANGFPHAERRALHGSTDLGDLTGLGPICVECKAGTAAERASDGQVALWLAETEAERVNARAEVGVLVMKRAGVGAANAGRWWAVLTLADLCVLTDSPRVWGLLGDRVPVRMTLAAAVDVLRTAGYGTPLPELGGAA